MENEVTCEGEVTQMQKLSSKVLTSATGCIFGGGPAIVGVEKDRKATGKSEENENNIVKSDSFEHCGFGWCCNYDGLDTD